MSALGGLAGIGGGLAGSAFSAYLSAKEAKKMRDFQERMYKNRYSYSMEDMRNSGLNPILAYKGISGGPPAGAMGQVPDFGASMARGAEAGVKGGLAAAQKALLGAQENSARAKANNDQSLADLQNASVPAAQAKRDLYNTPAGRAAMQVRELFGGQGFMPGVMGGVAGSAKGIYDLFLKQNRTMFQQNLPKPRGPRSRRPKKGQK